MDDPETPGKLVASALSAAAEAMLRGSAGEALKGACDVLKRKLAACSPNALDPLERDPSSVASQAFVTEILGRQSSSDQAEVRELTRNLIEALKSHGGVGLDVRHFEGAEISLGNITVAPGSEGARFYNANITGSLRTGNIEIGTNRHVNHTEREVAATVSAVGAQLNSSVVFGGIHVTIPQVTKLPTVAFPVSNEPIHVPRHFLGRDEDLDAIDTQLKRASVSSTSVALHGMRGVGKSSLAAAYASAHQAEYRAIWWVRADTPSGIQADLVNLGVRLGWIGQEEQGSDALPIVLDRLRQEGDGFLLVFDNAPSADAIIPFLPKAGRAKIIVTSNSPSWRGLAEPHEVLPWSSAIGAEFLEVRAGQHSGGPHALHLSALLGGLPLAHEQAAAYCERLSISFEEYFKRFQAAPMLILDRQADAPLEYYNKRTVAKTFILAIRAAAELNAGCSAVLERAALLSIEAIPLFLVLDAPRVFLSTTPELPTRDSLEDALSVLHSFALISREQIQDEQEQFVLTPGFRLHRLVREIVRAAIPEGTRSLAVADVAKVLALEFPLNVYSDLATWRKARRLDPHAFSFLVDQELSPSLDHEALEIASRLGLFRLRAHVSEHGTQPLLERALSLSKKLFGNDSLPTTFHETNLAGLLQQRGRLSEARSLFEHALTIRKSAFGPTAPETITSKSNFAGLLDAIGEHKSAQALYESIERIPRWPGDVAITLDNLGSNLFLQGMIADALQKFTIALPLFEQSFGAEHLETATCLANISRALFHLGAISQARSYTERALAIRERHLGPDSPTIVNSIDQLADILMALGDQRLALQDYERALEIVERARGPRHLETASALNNLGQALAENGDLDRAQAYLECAVQIKEEVYGQEHVSTAISIDNLGKVLRKRKEYDRALHAMRIALGIFRRKLGLINQDTASCLANIGTLYEEKGEPRRAIRYFRLSASIYERVEGPRSLSTARQILNIAKMQAEQSSWALARKYAGWALEIREKSLPPLHRDIVGPVLFIAGTYIAERKVEAALPLLERARSILRSAPSNWEENNVLNVFTQLVSNNGQKPGPSNT